MRPEWRETARNPVFYMFFTKLNKQCKISGPKKEKCKIASVRDMLVQIVIFFRASAPARPLKKPDTFYAYYYYFFFEKIRPNCKIRAPKIRV